MKWTDGKIQKLRALAFAGKPNSEIARELHVPVTEVYAKRSQLGITIDKVKAVKAEATVNPEFEKAAQDMDDGAVIHAKQELIRLLDPAIREADGSVKRLELSGDGTRVNIFCDGLVRSVNIDGDSPLATIADIVRKCMYGEGGEKP